MKVLASVSADSEGLASVVLVVALVGRRNSALAEDQMAVPHQVVLHRLEDLEYSFLEPVAILHR